MRVLIIGGTRFVGRHITEAALAAGHDVTVLHRGRTGADLFPQATHLLADRDGDLSILGGARWDVTIDVSAYRPGQVRALAAAVDTDRYVLISTTSVYDIPPLPGFTEDSPLLELPEGAGDAVTDETYGPLKVLCERAARELFGPSTVVVRPTYVVGPHDHLHRFGYWVDRLAQGGNVLAPMDRNYPMQLIDARDLAAFAVTLAGRGGSGTFHAVHPAPPYTFRDMLDDIADAVAPPGTTITWVGEKFLLDAGVGEAELPLWAAFDPWYPTNTADPAAAVAAGLRPRPVRESARDVLDAGISRADGWLSPERERRLLTEWRSGGVAGS